MLVTISLQALFPPSLAF
eukprot:CCRYP_019138-RG/>CCRYP_019138-RG protein AED:0.49 eAED:0.49 QI:0/-1/0/1/-1/0/1/0/17